MTQRTKETVIKSICILSIVLGNIGMFMIL